MNVFVTGHRGYIGSHLVAVLKQAGHRVTGCDLELFPGCEWEAAARPDAELIADVRSLTARQLEGYDAVCHLAAISNDPMGDLNEALTVSVNRDGSVHLARIAKQAGVPRYLFSGSCSVYGQGETLDIDETGSLNPLTAYARSKIETELAVRPLADESFSPTFLRNATAYGHSPMLRIDLVVNNLLACAHTTGEIRIMSDGSPWRPLVHCHDIARAFVALMEAPRERVHDLVVNVGGNDENYQVRGVADHVRSLVPGAAISYTGEVGADPRDYRVNFDLLGKVLPDFRLKYTLQTGMEELDRRYRANRFSLDDFEGPRFVRLRTLRGALGRLSAEPGAAAA
jgi:nucleoside-diphosphate-sugar epimerase